MEYLVNKIARYSSKYSSDENLFKKYVSEEAEKIRNLFIHDPATFVQNYNSIMSERDLGILLEFCDNKDARDLLNIDRIQKLKPNLVSSEIKNRRYFYILKSIREDDYFSLESIKQRYPLLFDQYLGKFKIEGQKDDIGTFSKFLIDHLAKFEHRKSLNMEAKKELDTLLENEKMVEDMNVDALDSDKNFQYLKKELYSIIFQEFISGNDKAFDYTKTDDINLNDHLDFLSAQREDDYFDSEPPNTSVLDYDDSNDDI